MKKSIQVTRSSMPDFEEYVEEIRGLWDSRWLTNMGKKHNHLEEELSKYLRVHDVALFTNGHLALESALDLLECQGEVITTPFTFASTTHAIVRRGLKPVFCDINQDDYTLDAGKIEALITENTTAILPVHVYGHICDVDRIEEIAKRHNLKVIYDAAHAFGVTKSGRGIASYGDISMFSFHATKVFHTIEGGALTCNDLSLASRIRKMRDFGFEGPESVTFVGGNGKMNEFQAAMGLCNLRHIDEEIEKREAVVERYREHLGDTRGIKLNFSQVKVKSNHAYFPVLFDGYGMNRDEIYERLRKGNIFPRKYFYPLTSSFECYKGRFDIKKTPIAKRLSERVLTLPLYGDMDSKQVDAICDIIIKGR